MHELREHSEWPSRCSISWTGRFALYTWVVSALLSATRALSIWTVRGPTECRADWVVGLPSAFPIYYNHHVASLNAPYHSIALCYAHSSCGAQRAALAFND